MAAPSMPTRRRVYAALRDGASLSEASRLLGRSRATIQNHANVLVANGCLVRELDGAGKGARYRRGARAMIYESQPDEGAAPPSRMVLDGARVHRGEFKVKVAPYGPHKLAPVFDRSWKASGVQFGEFWHSTWTGGLQQRVRVRECRGPHNISLLLQPEEAMVSGPAEVAEVERIWARRVDSALRALEAAYGYTPVGGVERASPIEYEWRAPALKPGMRAGPVWTDASVGRGCIETDSSEVAAAVAALPETEKAVRRLDEKVEALNARLVKGGLELMGVEE